MRILFAGSSAIAVPSLSAICNIDGIELAGVLTNPDSPRGRHGTPQPTDVGEAAGRLSQSVPVLKPEKLDACAREQVNSLKCDILVSFAYGHIFGPKFLALFPRGGINIHPSLLPKYRGPSPVQAAILNRESITGVTVQSLALKMDCGDILAVEQLQLTGRETAGSLSELLSAKAAKMLPETLKKIAAGTVKAQAQNDSEASYCTLISKDEGLIDWSQSAAEIEAKIRAFDPWPMCRTTHNGLELSILESAVYNDKNGNILENKPGRVLGTDKKSGILIQTGNGILAVTRLQYQTKKALFWRDFLNGARDFSGSQLG
ncbi:MAG: methionyl-tRNA formyltransferase [Treponema sp.]|jgi:methionyl-tRNA formyltransferase|nr:methionyl-tRNA formyltransferase [Treponema sp.]